MRINELIEDISGYQPLYKNSLQYESADWRAFKDLTVKEPVQRKLTPTECVMDLDHVSEMDMVIIPNWLKSTGMKFIAWQSGPNGMHIHFWANVYGKEAKKQLTDFFASKLEEKFGVKNDLLPMGHGHIRAENSIHPEKGYRKEMLMLNINVVDPINHIPPQITEKLINVSVNIPTGNNTIRNGKVPKCIRYMLSHQFSDGRERMLFAIASWYKANEYTDDENMQECLEWCKRQNYMISPHKIKATINSSTGKVGCRYRHNLLEDIGVDIGKCEYVERG